MSDPPAHSPGAPHGDPEGQRDVSTIPVAASPGPDAAPHSTERFPPGTMLARRYRIVARVGRGGMGEVYRADDLKLGQSVALKFLPPRLVTEGRWLQRFHDEVRIAREVAHPNICRVYDIVEDEGEHFISMEFIDGEDLHGLLHRIGRLPVDKGIQVARQMCAGLAAAHDKGVLHRDLKPANVMIDGRGNVRITDFGIAALADELEIAGGAAGTPAYMSPEQLEGGRLTARSDIYSLGLVLYEIFTGREAFAGETIEELRRSRTSGSASRPSSLVGDLDPMVERVIMRCLEPDPAQRPQTAIAVAAALPGGDPLALALAAGETPSPEMVAHAGGAGSLRPATAVTMLAATVALLVVGFWMTARRSIFSYNPIEHPPAVLVDRARQALAAAGHERPAHELWHFHAAGRGTTWLEEHDDGPERWERLRGFPDPVVFHYRGSNAPPAIITPDGMFEGDQPPLTAAGMSDMTLDGSGRLLGLAVVPRRTAGDEAPGSASWEPLLAAAGLDAAALAEAEPLLTPRVFCAERAAWTGAWPDDAELPVRVEAGAVGGQVVWFKLAFPWDLSDDQAAAGNVDLGFFFVPMILLVTGGAAFLAWRHMRRGRGDRRGAARLAAYVFLLFVMLWGLKADHLASLDEFGMLAMALARALLAAAVCWTMYMAVEPYARRYWPHVLVSWSRLITGRWRDPLVGRDVLAGCLAATAIPLLGMVPALIEEKLSDSVPAPQLNPQGLHALTGGRQVLGQLLEAQTSIGFFVGIFVLLLLARIVLRRQWLAVIVVAAVILVPGVLSGDSLAQTLIPVIFITGVLVTVLRLGFLSLLTLAVVMPVINFFPVTLDMSAWYFPVGLVGALAMLVPAVFGFWTSLGGQPLFKDDLA